MMNQTLVNTKTSHQFIPYATQSIDDDDIDAVVKTLKSTFLTTGPKVAEFEEAIKEVTGAKYAVTVNSGTAALHAACYAAGISSADEVITTPITFAATCNCVLYFGGKPVFCDIDPNTWNIDPDKIEDLITSKTKAIIPVHYTGQPCEMEKIRKIAKKHNLIVIEDAAHALGASYRDMPIGSISDMTCFSFHAVKHITTGEGGCVTTNREDIYKKLQLFRSHGITKDSEQFQANEDLPEPWYYEQQFLGFNYRLTDIQAALGVSQIKKLPAFIERREEIAAAYFEAFSPLAELGKMTLPTILKHAVHAWHIFVIKVNPEQRSQIFQSLIEKGLGVNLHYIPVYLHPYYQRLGYQKGLCPEAEALFESIITLPLFPKMTESEIAYVIDCVIQSIEACDI